MGCEKNRGAMQEFPLGKVTNKKQGNTIDELGGGVLAEMLWWLGHS